MKVLQFRRPRLSGVPGQRPPKGWGALPDTDIQRLPPELRIPKEEPAGEPPEDWPGTRPEWAVFWALERLDLREGIDFEYEAVVPGMGTGIYSTIDFWIPHLNLAIEVQGLFWHHELGHERHARDLFRRTEAAQHGMVLIFIDEDDALTRPIEMVKAAMRYEDHSFLGRR